MMRIIESLATALNSRTAREKLMFVGLGICAVLVLDYFFWVQPVLKSYSQSAPELSKLKRELFDLVEDQKNEKIIFKKWQEAQKELAQKEKAFIDTNQLPILLENLSKIASSSGLKITSLNPQENSFAQDKDKKYLSTMIKMSALAGTHEFGKFLARLENSEIFFNIENVKISSNPMDDRRHLIELSMSVYRKNKKYD